jgi:hypothetical protein
MTQDVRADWDRNARACSYLNERLARATGRRSPVQTIHEQGEPITCLGRWSAVIEVGLEQPREARIKGDQPTMPALGGAHEEVVAPQITHIEADGVTDSESRTSQEGDQDAELD